MPRLRNLNRLIFSSFVLVAMRVPDLNSPRVFRVIPRRNDTSFTQPGLPQRVPYLNTPDRLDRLNSRYLLSVRMLAHSDQHLPVPSQGPTFFEACAGGERLFPRASRCGIHFAEAS